MTNVGNTKQYLTNQKRQHKYDLEEKQKQKRKKIAVHHFEQLHNFDLEYVKITT